MRPLIRYAILAAAMFFVAFSVYAKTASEIYELAAKSTVVVANIDDKGEVQTIGSGVVISNKNVVTNCHVIKGASQIKVLISDEIHSANLRYSDWDRDICSLSVKGLNAQAVVIGNSKTLKIGAPVYAIGAPNGLKLTLSDGIISNLRKVEGGHYIQTTAAISKGSSGGGLFDEDGALVGLTTFYLAEGQNLNFAVPVEWVTELPKRSTKVLENTQPVTQWMNKAIELEEHKDWPALLLHSLRWTKAQPDSELAWVVLGIAYQKSGQHSKAIKSYEHSLRINSESSIGWLNLGIAYQNSGQLSKAIEAYQQDLQINPKNEKAWYNLGIAYQKSGQYAKSIEAYQQALHINPKYEQAQVNLGLAYQDSGQYAKSIETYQQALHISSTYETQIWFNMAISYQKSGQSSKAIDAYQQALRINPKYADAWGNLGNIFFKNGEFAKAIQFHKRSIRINPENATAWYNLGRTYDALDQTTKSIESYQRALRINPELVNAWYNLGLIYQNSGQSTEAIDAYQQALRINPKDEDAWNNLGIIYASLNQRSKELEVYKQLKTLNSKFAEDFSTQAETEAKSVEGRASSEVLRKKMIKESHDEFIRLPDGRKKLDAAAAHFMGYYLANARMRPEYCSSLGVTIPTFVSKFEKINQRELISVRKILAASPEYDEETSYKHLKSVALKDLKIGFKLQASEAKMTEKEFCQTIESNAAEYAGLVRYSKDMPLHSKILIEAKH